MTFVLDTARSRLARVPGALDALNRIAADHFVTVDDVLSSSRKAEHVAARHTFVHVLRSTLALSFPRIGRLIGRDHTTCVEADRKHSARVAAEYSAVPS